MPRNYDAIVIGAGMGGLMCGNFLARAGRRVLMLEHNHQPGGLMAGFWRKGFYFDAGDQSIENMGIVFPLLKQLGLYHPDDWERAMYRFMHPGMDHIITDFAGTAEALAKVFPTDAEGIRRFFSKLEEFSAFMQKATDKGRLPFTATGLEQIVGVMRLVMLGMQNMSLAWEMINGKIEALAKHYISDPEALNFLLMPGYQGMSIMNGAGFWHMWVHDYWYPRRGIQSLMDALAGNFCAHGGQLRFKTMVEQIIISGGRALGVRTGQGETLYAKHIIYCGDMIRLYTRMLPKGTASAAFLNKITTAPVAEPLVALYLGLDIEPSELHKLLKVHHTFYMPRNGAKELALVNDPDMHRDTWIEINAPCLDNPALAPAGRSAVTVQTMTNCHWMNTWGTGGDERARPDEYRRLKEKVKDDLLHNLENVIPGVRDKVAYWDLGTPLSTIRFTLNKEGGSCAFTFDPDLAPFSRRPAQFRTPVRGLYMAGQWSLWPGGIVGAAMSGKIVAAHILSGIYCDATDRVYQLIRRARRVG
ncbi:MAG: NAD(P)/FAD-dependent oxidoreductase [Syntrophaceae bacterium]